MPANVEIKARVHNEEALKQIASKLSNSDGELIQQEDTFFCVPNGRLKLRQLQNPPAQLIFYHRPDGAGPKTSQYHITLVENPEDLKVTLSLALGVKGSVRKRRLLYLVGQTRVHVDHVQDLGTFMELEVVMRDGQSAEEGQKIAEHLMEQLNIKQEDLVQGAYMDLLNKNKDVPSRPTVIHPCGGK